MCVPSFLQAGPNLHPLPFTLHFRHSQCLGSHRGSDLGSRNFLGRIQVAPGQSPSWDRASGSLRSGTGECHGQLPRVPKQVLASGLEGLAAGLSHLRVNPTPYSPQCQPVAASISSTRDTKAPGDHAAVRSVYLSLNMSYVSVNFCGWTNSIEF